MYSSTGFGDDVLGSLCPTPQDADDLALRGLAAAAAEAEDHTMERGLINTDLSTDDDAEHLVADSARNWLAHLRTALRAYFSREDWSRGVRCPLCHIHCPMPWLIR